MSILLMIAGFLLDILVKASLCIFAAYWIYQGIRYIIRLVKTSVVRVLHGRR